jgi:hypothetical protein
VEQTSKSPGSFWSDTIALLIYIIIGGVLPLVFEMGVFHFTLVQFGGLHFLFFFRHIPVGRLCGKMRNYLCRYYHKRVASLFAIYICELPLYVVIALIVGIDKKQVFNGFIIQLVNNALLVLAGLYDLILDRARQYFASRSCRTKLARQAIQAE